MQIFQDPKGRHCLTIGDTDIHEKTNALFEDRGLQGNGYTWEGIVAALIALHLPAEAARLRDLGAEADNVYLYCDDRALLERVAELFRQALADHQLLEQAIEQAGDDLE